MLAMFVICRTLVEHGGENIYPRVSLSGTRVARVCMSPLSMYQYLERPYNRYVK